MKGVPVLAGLVSALVGSCLAVGGVYLLVGAGWALVAGAIPFFGFAWIMFKGLSHAA